MKSPLSARGVRQATQPRRGLSREESAISIGISTRKFDEMVTDGRMPRPKMIDARRSGYPPRGMNRDEAARYIGVGTTLFDRLVAERRMPKPTRVGKRVIWDRFKLDAAFTELGEEESENPLDRALGMSAGRR